MVRVRQASEGMRRANLAERLFVSGRVNYLNLSQTSMRDDAQQQIDKHTRVGSVCMHAIEWRVELS